MDSDLDFKKLKDAVQKKLDFPIVNYTDSFLQRRFETRLRAHQLGMTDFAKYQVIMESSEDERQALLKELTIHVTHFFRDKPMWEAFQSKLIPELIRRKKAKGDSIINIWSAGCSTGEEPISIIICFKEVLGNEFNDFKIKIIANDYDIITVSKAKLGIYEEPQFQEMDSKIKEKYFSVQSDGRLKVDPSLLQYINYSQGDILGPNKPKNQDIVFCRNTVIYFQMDTKTKFYDDVYNDVLRSGGFFIMGKTETLLGDSRPKFSVFDGTERMFLKE